MKPILTLLASGFCALALAISSSAQEGYPVPQFRLADPALQAPELPAGSEIRLLADADFPPFSFAAGDGRPLGLAVDAALAACAEIKVRCTVTLKPFGELVATLARGEAEVLVSGPRLSVPTLAAGDATRPFYRALARFAVRRDSPLNTTDPEALTGQRLGAVRNTSHAAWLSRYYSRTALTFFDSAAAAREGLKAGQLDLLFGDALGLVYWVAGEASGGCCKLLDGGYNDPSSFSHPLVFFVRRDRPDLRRAMDYGLDRTQATGAFADVFRRYVPASPW